MSYVAPKDYTQDPEIVAKIMRTISGQLELTWMKNIGERAAFRPSQTARGLTLDDINQGSYSPDHLPEIVRHNFSMAPRGAILPPGLPSLGYRLNRKSDVWADIAPRLYEEGKSRRWAPAHDVPWDALAKPGHSEDVAIALRQLSTNLTSAGLVACDTAASFEYRMNQEFHEIKFLMCVQMYDAARIAEAFRKRALAGDGQLGVDCAEFGDFLKTIFVADSYAEASVSMNVLLFSWVQALGRHIEYTATNRADTFLGTRLAQDASRFIAYGVAHIRNLLRVRPIEVERLDNHLDLAENALVGALGAPAMIEPLVLISGGFEPVVGLYERTVAEYFGRCLAAGLGDRSARSPLPEFLRMLRS